ncbi:transglutaminase-like domain-containing protein [Salipiger mangrovisoli]|uniref:Transglutaminase domain-containing protein n=1 Tax=Salipiger mangrovisoli TaxID=2865933 RepID=A0ABR9X0L4_9RHOB|nr:transglutaminase-like domain-containing protein [Salipiger mangrovisoli]MBE9637079.1 transglutaminase domain-containing protein [Salipiger mangrovisoli]
MRLDRRNMIMAGAAFSVLPLLPRGARAAFAPTPADWRRFEVTTRVDIAADGKPVQAWLPVPSVNEDGWMKAEAPTWSGNADSAELKTDEKSGAQFIHAVWSTGQSSAELEVAAVVSTRDRATDLSAPGAAASLSDEDRAFYTAPTRLIPTDGIVKATSNSIVGDIDGDLAKARALYEWVVESSERNPETRGCGIGDVASMLEMGDLTGKCADLNALYVGLARAAGLPARDVYGLRVAPSNFGYKSLGAGSSDVTKAQHCRAEVFLDTHGWVAVDPADVRKVILEEPPKNLSLDDPKVRAVRAALFGAWEGNWVGLNFAHDVALPGSSRDEIGFLMYPQAEIDGVEQDELDPQSFAYAITATELS